MGQRERDRERKRDTEKRRENQRKLHKAHFAMLRKMVSPKQPEHETRAHLMHRSTVLLQNLMAQHGIERWDLHYHRLHFAWADHVARMVDYDPKRLTYLVFNFRCLDWIHAVSEQFP